MRKLGVTGSGEPDGGLAGVLADGEDEAAVVLVAELGGVQRTGGI